MSPSSSSRLGSAGRILSVIAVLLALVVCLVTTITDSAAWPALVVAVLAFASANLHALRARREGGATALPTAFMVLGVCAIIWALVLVVTGI